MLKWLLGGIAGWMVVLTILWPTPAGALTDKQVEKKIQALQEDLYDEQDKKYGGWFDKYDEGPDFRGGETDDNNPRNRTGPTAIVCLALLISGESAQDPRLGRGLAYLRSTETTGTYALSLRTHVWSYLPDAYLDDLERDATRLLGGAMGTSSWRYVCYPPVLPKGLDNSTNQYGILGMWQYAKRGGRLPNGFWEKAGENFLKWQNSDGGWGYGETGESAKTRVSMTCAGLTCLAVVQQERFRDQDQAPAKLAESIDKGLANLDKTLTAGGGYQRYGIERVALATGVKYIKGKDWFEFVGEAIIRGRATNIIDNSFDLMFLSRGRIPVWCNKFKWDKGVWNNRPNDIYFLSRHLSKYGQKEVNWQFVGLDRPAGDYIAAPVAWISTDKPLALSKKEKANLKRYLDWGGTLVANNESSTAVERSFIALAAELYPDLAWRDVERTDPIANLLIPVEGRGKPSVQVLGNGARDLIFMPKRDWGLTLQKSKDLTTTVPGQMMTNLYAMVSDRGSLPNRLERPFPKRTKSGGKSLWVAQARYGPDAGQGNPEPEAWMPVRNTLANKAGVNLRWAGVPLAEIGGGKMTGGAAKRAGGEGKPITLVHLAGVDPVELSQAEKDALKAYVGAGGTVLVETVGGRGDFAVEMDKQLRDLFGGAARKLGRVDPIISGKGLSRGKPVAKVFYRKFSIINMNAGTKHRLRAMEIDGRPAVIISSEDLSLAALGVRHWGVNGYQTDSARQILSNILMAAKKSAPKGTSSRKSTGKK